MASSWQPPLRGAAAQRARSALLQIVRRPPFTRADARPSALDADHPSASGVALLRAYAPPELCATLLPRGAPSTTPAADERGASLFGPLGASAWIHAQVRGRSRDRAHFARTVRTALVQRTAGDQDLISGTVGHGLYALECRHGSRAASVPFGMVLTRLDALCAASPDALPILRRARRGSPPAVDLGMAHGMAGVVALLAMAVRRGVRVRSARDRLRRFADWLVAHALEGSNRYSYATDDLTLARAAWCYGDPGAAVALLAAGRALRDRRLVARAIALAHDAAARPYESSGVVDAGLCHGSAGLAHIFARLFNATGDDAFRRASASWFGRTLDLQRSDGSFLSHRGGARFVVDDGFLGGGLGIALALVSSTAPIEPSWDRVLLLELPHRRAR